MKINELNEQKEKMEAEILRMDKESQALITVKDLDDKLLIIQKDIMILNHKKENQEDFINALTIRRDGLKSKFDNFRINHPVE